MRQQPEHTRALERHPRWFRTSVISEGPQNVCVCVCGVVSSSYVKMRGKSSAQKQRVQRPAQISPNIIYVIWLICKCCLPAATAAAATAADAAAVVWRYFNVFHIGSPHTERDRERARHSGLQARPAVWWCDSESGGNVEDGLCE